MSDKTVKLIRVRNIANGGAEIEVHCTAERAKLLLKARPFTGKPHKTYSTFKLVGKPEANEETITTETNSDDSDKSGAEVYEKLSYPNLVKEYTEKFGKTGNGIKKDTLISALVSGVPVEE